MAVKALGIIESYTFDHTNNEFNVQLTIHANGSTDSGYDVGPFAAGSLGTTVNLALVGAIKTRAIAMGATFGLLDVARLMAGVDLL